MQTTAFVEEVPCPLCGASPSPRPRRTEVVRFDGMQILLGLHRCRECALVFVSPRLNEKALARWYADYDQTVGGECNTQSEPQRLRYESFKRVVASWLPPKGRLLDIGTGTGLFLDALRDLNISYQATEFSPDAATKARLSGHQVFTGGLLEVEELLTPPFDVVTLLDVLEHLSSPRIYLERIRELLTPEGVLVVAVPNYRYMRLAHGSALSWLARGRPPTLYPAEHMQNFTRTTLTRMLDRAGFEIVAWENTAPILTGPSRLQMLKRAGWNFLRETRWFQENVLGIIAVARAVEKTP